MDTQQGRGVASLGCPHHCAANIPKSIGLSRGLLQKKNAGLVEYDHKREQVFKLVDVGVGTVNLDVLDEFLPKWISPASDALEFYGDAVSDVAPTKS